MLACLSKNGILTANFSKLMKALWSPKVGKDMVKHKETAPDEEKETPQNSDKNCQNIREGQNVGAKYGGKIPQVRLLFYHSFYKFYN